MSRLHKIRNNKIRREFYKLQERGWSVKQILDELSPKYYLTPARLRDIVYKTQYKEMEMLSEPGDENARQQMKLFE